MMELLETRLFAGEVGATLVPTILVTLFFLVAYGLYRIRCRRGDFPRFEEVETRPASNILSRHFRTFLLWCVHPLERFLIKTRVNPNWITLTALFFAALSGVLLAFGQFGLGGWVYVFSGICDVFDGRVARKTNRVTASGSILDSVLDRYAEFFIFAGLAVFYAGSWVFLFVLFALFGSMMVSYVRAKAESMKISCTVGRFQRAERLVYLGAGLALSPIAAALFSPLSMPGNWFAVLTVIFIAAGANGTALYRFVFTRHKAEAMQRQADIADKAGTAVNPSFADARRHCWKTSA
jgi:phosphatidylglycerophosphate synthase